MSGMIKSPLFRIGSGYDVHKFTPISNPDEGFITVCGIKIAYHQKIIAHSDGDVGIHALVDAILGAIGCGDIGEHFPSADCQWQNMNSDHFLVYACNKAKEKGYVVSNADITIICEQPKISPYKEQMQTYIAQLLQIDATLVNVKATTTEKLGFIGRSEGIAVQAVVSCILL